MKSKLRPDVYFILFLALSIILHFIFPIKKIIYPPYTYPGFLLIAFGAILNIWSDLLFKRRKTTVKPYENPIELEVSGPFRISRHPMYLGFMAILLGVAILHGTLITFVFPVLFVILMELMFIPFEEKSLERSFGKNYLDYKKKVRRWI
jgi:protein-S-isoprenylcysteine O-methyltransferase Ste14